MCWFLPFSHSLLIILLGASLIFAPVSGYPPEKLNVCILIYFVGIVMTWFGICINSICERREQEIIFIPPLRQSSPIQLTVTGNTIPVICPICRQHNVVFENQSKLFGVENKCAVCLEHVCEVYLPTCRHVCLCYNCALHVKSDVVLPV